MRRIQLFIFLLGLALKIYGQSYDYEVSKKNPFGLLNPNAPSQIAEYAQIIGSCDCKSVSRINQNTWTDTVSMVWTFKYIMNGMAVQDETLKADGTHSGSIRQYNADSSTWYIHYYSSTTPVAKLPTWNGGKTDSGNIILYKDAPAPNGTPGNFRITFSNIDKNGFDWTGEWVNKPETFVYPTWKIFCKR